MKLTGDNLDVPQDEVNIVTVLPFWQKSFLLVLR